MSKIQAFRLYMMPPSPLRLLLIWVAFGFMIRHRRGSGRIGLYRIDIIQAMRTREEQEQFLAKGRFDLGTEKRPTWLKRLLGIVFARLFPPFSW